MAWKRRCADGDEDADRRRRDQAEGPGIMGLVMKLPGNPSYSATRRESTGDANLGLRESANMTDPTLMSCAEHASVNVGVTSRRRLVSPRDEARVFSLSSPLCVARHLTSQHRSHASSVARRRNQQPSA